MPNTATANVTREGRIRFGLVEGESLLCGHCESFIAGGTGPDGSIPECCHGYITMDGLETQDYTVLCGDCLNVLTGPEFET